MSPTPRIGTLLSGPRNAISDVGKVRVGRALTAGAGLIALLALSGLSWLSKSASLGKAIGRRLPN